MLQTHHRSKLPRTLSYPIGAEALSAAVEDVVHGGEIELDFYAHPIEPASRFQEVIEKGEPYSILIAVSLPRRKPGVSGALFMIERGYYEPRIELAVYPVLREFRQAANRCLIEQGMPELAHWLSSLGAPDEWRETRRIELIFDPRDKKLSIQSHCPC
jgi:hypothetical protein